jgi:hypothetical protein
MEMEFIIVKEIKRITFLIFCLFIKLKVMEYAVKTFYFSKLM